jgi:hypothetical protein
MLVIAEPATYRSPGSTSGSTAARAALNGAPSSTVRNTSAHSIQNGIACSAISATRPALRTSQTTITRRRGNRSARPDSTGPPTIGGM